jgi:hypothetical protein
MKLSIGPKVFRRSRAGGLGIAAVAVATLGLARAAVTATSVPLDATFSFAVLAGRKKEGGGAGQAAAAKVAAKEAKAAMAAVSPPAHTLNSAMVPTAPVDSIGTTSVSVTS